MTLSEKIQSQTRNWIFAQAILILIVIGIVDYWLPWEVTLQMFYFVPIFYAAWYGGRNMALLIAVLSAVVWWLANLHSMRIALSVYNWAGVNRLVMFAFGAFGGAAMRSHREIIQARVAALERTRELEEEIVRVSEREQMRIGQDLHDGICQHLAAIDCAVACLRLDLEDSGSPEVASALFIQQQLGSAIAEARDMARGIFPVQMDEEGFLAALEELVETTNRVRQHRISLEVLGEIKIRDPQVGMHLFRIAQEALNNAVKHAHASRVKVTLLRADRHLEMTIADDGVGFQPERPAYKGIGMQTMRYRVKSMGGRLDIHDGAGGGTEVSCIVPLESPVLSNHDDENRKSAGPRGAGGGSPDVPRMAGAPDLEEGLVESLRGS